MKTAIISDEFTQDPFTAFEIGTGWGFNDFEIRNAYRWRLPFCPSWVADKTVAAAKGYGVKVVGISPGIFKPVMNVDGSNTPVSADTPAEIRRHIDELLPRSFDFADRIGTKNITVFALPRGDAPQDASVPSVVIETLAEVAEKGKAAGFNIRMENNPGSWGNAAAPTAEILKGVGAAALKLVWDPANSARSDTATDAVREGYPLIRDFVAGVHVKDVAEIDGRMTWVMLGDGVVDWKSQLKMLQSDGYAGHLVLEPHIQYENEKYLVSAVRDYVEKFGLLGH
ncbi:MAG: sugar phosphate isomerase/epimerase [Planctomycetes bacterium]|nr:sugar phosphate isomerase/epimerase [Planctomycetota bacterium]